MAESNGAMLKELVRFVQEQREQNRRHEETNRRQEAINRRQEEINRNIVDLIHEQRAEFRQLHRESEKRWTKLFREHEKWMRDHEVRLKLHYRMHRG